MEAGEEEKGSVSSSWGKEERQLKIFYTNTNGLFNKLDELKIFLSLKDKNIGIICVTETHFTKDIHDSH